MANVNIAPIFAWRNGIQSSRLMRRNSHHTTKWLVGDLNIRSEFTGGLPQFVVVQVRLCKVITQQSDVRYDSIIAPSLMLETDDIDYQGITWFCLLHIHWTSERMNVGNIECSKRLRGRIRADLIV